MDDLWSASRRVLRPVVLGVESRGGLGENLGFQVDDNARGSCEFPRFRAQSVVGIRKLLEKAPRALDMLRFGNQPQKPKWRCISCCLHI